MRDPTKPSIIPKVTCPQCGSHMRLSMIVPEGKNRERVTYQCNCGFDYRQSQKVQAEATRQSLEDAD